MTSAATPPYIKVIPWEKFVYRLNDRWMVESPVTDRGIVDFIVAQSGDAGSYETVKASIKAGQYPRAAGVDMMPGRPALVRLPEGLFVNTWTPPTRSPNPGAGHERILRVLDWLTGHDERGREWLVQWMAAKVQNPELVPKTAVLFAGPPGSGKNTFSLIMQEMLGRKNCTEISRRNLENKFNARWIDKLFVFADEITTRENLKDVSQDMKRLITSSETELEGKGKDQVARRNRLALAIGSNDDVTPVWIESGDRRYTVFTNHDTITAEYRDLISSCFYANEPTEDFLREVEGFWAYLLTVKVSHDVASRPYDNPDRHALIVASSPPHRAFFQAVEERGLDAVVVEVTKPLALSQDLTKTDSWVSKNTIYEVYKGYCESLGGKALGRVRFAAAVRNHRPVWPVSEDGLSWLVRRGEKKVDAPANVLPLHRG